mmetsp:Transcript_16459/g.29552  ORF Transcript_16459/g.29552 Transcript_16459/m.29552 type:complete len:90 (-) Transcript_16459:286-555(-)
MPTISNTGLLLMRSAIPSITNGKCHALIANPQNEIGIIGSLRLQTYMTINDKAGPRKKRFQKNDSTSMTIAPKATNVTISAVFPGLDGL